MHLEFRFRYTLKIRWFIDKIYQGNSLILIRHPETQIENGKTWETTKEQKCFKCSTFFRDIIGVQCFVRKHWDLHQDDDVAQESAEGEGDAG